MADKKKYLHLSLLLALAFVCTLGKDCPSLLHKNLICYNDFNHTIDCFWNSTYEDRDTECTIHAEKITQLTPYRNSCKLEPVELSRPLQKKCSVVFEKEWRFQAYQEWTINLTCNNIVLTFLYKPKCHVKLNPPTKPHVNLTTISWFPQVTEHKKFPDYNCELQWKKKDQPWSRHRLSKECKWNCTAQLPDDIIQGEWYEARVRVQPIKHSSTWSEWSPTVSWLALTGKVIPKPPLSAVATSIFIIFGFIVALAVLIILVRIDKTTWVYIGKRIRGPPLPNPGKSFLQNVNFQNFVSPHFSRESFHAFFKPVDIVPVEITSAVDLVLPSGPEATLQEKMKSKSSFESTSSSFSNPSYSHLPPPPVLSLSASNLEACDTDMPYGPVRLHSGSKTAEQNSDDVRGNMLGLQQLLSRSSKSGPVPVIFEYEKVESQVQCLSFNSQDSGLCSGKEDCEERLEADQINVTDGHNEGPANKEETAGGMTDKIDFQKLFGVRDCFFDQGSIQVCSGYEQVEKLQATSHELPSLDSGVSSGGEDQPSQEESLDDTDTESTHLLFSPPPLPSPSECSLPTCIRTSFNFSGTVSSAVSCQ